MPALADIPKGKTPAEASDVQQLVDLLTARRNAPIAVTVNDPLKYAFTIKNTDPGSRGIILYAADGTTVLFQADGSGVKVSPDGTAATAPLTQVGSGAAPQVAAGNHVHGAGGYSSTGATTLEALFANTWVTTGLNYVVPANILFVFCSAGITVTLPDATTTNRWIIITAITGSTTVIAAAGAVHGGSVNTTTGAIMDGVVSQGDSIMYKSDGAAWRAVG